MVAHLGHAQRNPHTHVGGFHFDDFGPHLRGVVVVNPCETGCVLLTHRNEGARGFVRVALLAVEVNEVEVLVLVDADYRKNREVARTDPQSNVDSDVVGEVGREFFAVDELNGVEWHPRIL